MPNYDLILCFVISFDYQLHQRLEIISQGLILDCTYFDIILLMQMEEDAGP